MLGYAKRLTTKIKTAPKTVKNMVSQELCLLWASGKISLAPIYKRKPAKKAKYKTKNCAEMANNKVAAAPITGAKASNNKNTLAFVSVFL